MQDNFSRLNFLKSNNPNNHGSLAKGLYVQNFEFEGGVNYMLNTFVLMCTCPSYLLLHILTPKGGVASDFTFEAKVTFFCIQQKCTEGYNMFYKTPSFLPKVDIS